jgi:hypothetical protein
MLKVWNEMDVVLKVGQIISLVVNAGLIYGAWFMFNKSHDTVYLGWIAALVLVIILNWTEFGGEKESTNS